MALTEITATKEIDGQKKSASVGYDFGDSVADAITKFGEDVVFSNFKRAATITAQAAMRRMLESGKSQEDISATMNSWKPGVALERNIDPVSSITNNFDKLSDEEQDAIIAKLKAKKKAAK